MQSMDELIELMSQAAQMEKGALGLFFEMNHFVGIGLSIYIGYFILGVKTLKFGGAKQTPQDLKFSKQYKLMYNWIYFQFIWIWFCLLFSIMVYCMYKGINNRVARNYD